MTAPPAKIKAFLGDIKENYLDNTATGLSSYEHMFQGLVKVELVLRGTLVHDEKRLWQHVQSSIGKTLLGSGDSKIPRPLVAGANVMAGRVAEALAQVTPHPEKKYQIDVATLQRAKDIKDQRWTILFKQEASFLEVAQGYYTTAALIQTDTPPMWKKVWDTWSSIQQQKLEGSNDEESLRQSFGEVIPFEAQTSIENLIRIASLKGNSKRVAELQVRLVLACLNPHRLLKFESSAPSKKQPPISIAESFGDTITSKLVLNSKDLGQIADKAERIVTECSVDQLTEIDQWLIPVLSVRVGLLKEEAQQEALAIQLHQQNHNRSVSSSIESCRFQARQQILLRNKDSLATASHQLRDSVALLWKQPRENLDRLYWLPTLKWIQNCVERMKDRALAQSQFQTQEKTDVWNALWMMLLPLVNSLKEASRWSLGTPRAERMSYLRTMVSSSTEDEREYLSYLALTLTEVYWMLLAQPLKVTLDEVLKLILDLLSILIQHGPPPVDRASSTAVGSKSKESSIFHQWKVSRSVLICGMAQGNQLIIDQVTRDATAMKRKRDVSLEFLQCMVAWSGWYQRPWSYCSNLSDIRRILIDAQVTGVRNLSLQEKLLLDLARADAELMNGGFLQEGQRLYSQALNQLNFMAESFDPFTLGVLQAHCHCGLARASNVGDTASASEVYEQAKKSLEMLESLGEPTAVKPLHMWHECHVFESSITHGQSVARQLIADSLVLQGKSDEAKSFLEDAVHDAPMDANAALALGALMLRIAFYVEETSQSQESSKLAQIHLLKAAKLDPSQADPFALLGVWFEEVGDEDRAVGCFLKCLAIDPCNPVAGRGLLRLKTREAVSEQLDRAIRINSPVCGWAWRAVGLNKIFLEAADEFAVVALLKSLRSRDISSPKSEPLSIFYNPPNRRLPNERAAALADLAACYRRLGRFTASIRAFHSSIESAGDMVSDFVLCSCAQVELELSLYEEAAENFAHVLAKQDSTYHAIAAYGQGIALYSLAQRDVEDGKAGSAMASIKRAIYTCEKFPVAFACTRKLLGDLYSFGASLPPATFMNGDVEKEACIDRQLDFVKRGELAYRSILDLRSTESFQFTSTKCDVASNILLQAQLYASKFQESVDKTGASALYDKAAVEFRAILDLDPLYAPAWCGLGCSVLWSDPLLAQHAFSRCLEIEPMFPEAYANVGFLYTSNGAFNPSESVMNALTQVADTPMMWMNRAFMLERHASSLLISSDQVKAARSLSQAADAYRAALQVMRHSDAQLGLALTSRVMPDDTRSLNKKQVSQLNSARRKEAMALTMEYKNSSFRLKETISLLDGFSMVEQASETPAANWSEDSFLRGEEIISETLGQHVEETKLNLEAIQEGQDQIVRTKESVHKEQDFPIGLSLQRQILHEPGRADLWLLLAKELLRPSDDQPDKSTGVTHKVTAAAMASERAAFMLSEELVNPQKVGGRVVSSVSSAMLSEATSLSHWLQQCQRDTGKDERDQPEGDESVPTTPSSLYALQHALMMDPTNSLSREALKLETL